MEEKKVNILPIFGLLFIFSVLAAPILIYDLPFTQWDAGVYYTLTEAYDQGGQDAVYSLDPSITKVSDHPLLIIQLMSFSKKFMSPAQIMNGLPILIIVFVSLFFFFLLTKKMYGTSTALILSALALVNFRLFYELYSGIWATLLASCIAIIALYFLWKSLEGQSWSASAIACFFTILTINAHTITGLYLVFLETLVIFGYWLENNITLKLFDLTAKKKINNNLVYFSWPLIISIMSLIGAIITVALIPSREGWVSPWINGLLQSYGAFPVAWQYFLLIENPIIIGLVLLSLFWLVKDNQWRIVMLLLGGWLIINSLSFIGGQNVPALAMHVNKFYVLFYFLMILAIGYLFIKTKENVVLRRTLTALLVLAFLIQLVKIGYLESKISPAITFEELEAAESIKGKNVLLIHPIEESNSFRSFSWVYFLSSPEQGYKTRILDHLPDNLTEEFILVSGHPEINEIKGYDREGYFMNKLGMWDDKDVVLIYRKSHYIFAVYNMTS